ncbi:hypothetical protein FQA39_LY14212 [Lamprigera yunnana]|nr:hypothetical protein FQA39_LY14212 [Lamprigera yunnana]
MEVNKTDGTCPIKSEVLIKETFFSDEVYEDHASPKLKCEAVDCKDPLLLHPDEESFSCTYCQFTYTERDEYVQHMKIHVDCKGDNFKVMAKDFVLVHLKVNEDETIQKSLESEIQYFCMECNYSTKHRHTLKMHNKIHSGEQYTCNQCIFKTSWQSSLKLHLETHNNVQYFCKGCDFKTTRKTILEAHCKIHKGEQYACTQCNFKTI